MLARMAASTTGLVAISLLLFVLTRPEAGLAKPLSVDPDSDVKPMKTEIEAMEASPSRQK